LTGIYIILPKFRGGQTGQTAGKGRKEGWEKAFCTLAEEREGHLDTRIPKTRFVEGGTKRRGSISQKRPKV